jgi:hypothetical protein
MNAEDKQGQSPITAFADDSNAIKLDFRKLRAKWIIAMHQSLAACESKELKEMVEAISKVNLASFGRKVTLQVITDQFLEVRA